MEASSELQEFLEETDFLDPFQSSFRLGFGKETDFVASADFDTLDHSIL